MSESKEQEKEGRKAAAEEQPAKRRPTRGQHEEEQKQFGDDGEGLEQWGAGPAPQGFQEVPGREDQDGNEIEEEVDPETDEAQNLASTAREAREAAAAAREGREPEKQ